MVGEFATEIANQIAGVQVRVIGQHPRRIARHHEVAVRLDDGVGREGKSDARDKLPPGQVHRVAAAVV